MTCTTVASPVALLPVELCCVRRLTCTSGATLCMALVLQRNSMLTRSIATRGATSREAPGLHVVHGQLGHCCSSSVLREAPDMHIDIREVYGRLVPQHDLDPHLEHCCQRRRAA